MKIKITGLPKYQQRPGTVGNAFNFISPFMQQGNPLSGVTSNDPYLWTTPNGPIPPNPDQIEQLPYAEPSFLRKIGQGVKETAANRQILSKDNIPNTVAYGSKGERVGEWKDEKYIADPTKKKPTKNNEYGMAVAGAMNSGLSFFNNTLQGAQENKDLSAFTRKYGQTDAFNPVVSNPYSRGRNVMNTGEYAPNQMTPVQFAGRPTSEYVGYPTSPYNVYAQDGLSVTEDVLGLPTLYSDPGMYANAPGPSSSSVAPTGDMGEANAEIAANFTAPVKNYKISSGFGHRTAPIKGASTEHNGVDLAVPLNSAVFSPMDGVVDDVYFNEKGGKQVIIRHSDGSRSGFAHLNNYSVSKGDSVTKGQQIALSGNTGNSGGPHLHFTFRNPTGDFINPVDFFNLTGGTKNKYQTGVSNWDHNNPGNIHSGGFAKGYGGLPGREDNGGKVAIFPTMESGIKAMQDLIFSPSYSNLTISQARNKWVNGSPDQFTSSTSGIVKSMGADVPLNQLNAQQRKQLLSEFIKWEDRSVYDKLHKQGYFKQGGEVPDNNTNMKIRITGTPEEQQFADGGKTVGDQMGYGLYRGQAVRDFNAFNKPDEANYDENVRSTENGVPRKDANIEAEKGEKIIAPNGLSIMDIGGKAHSKGGTPMDAEPGSYIVSDFVNASKTMQDAMGFDIASKKKKDNTWSKVLDSKVKSKDFNRLSQIIQAAAAGKQVDKYELAMAKSKMPLYQNYMSKAALGNELSKMMQGKPYEIPDIAKPALIQMFPDMAEKMGMGQPQQGQPGQQPMSQEEGAMAKFGKTIPQYQSSGITPFDAIDPNDVFGVGKLLQDLQAKTNKGFQNPYGKGVPYPSNTISPYTGDRYENKDNASKYSKEEWTQKLKDVGYDGNWTNEDIQKWLYTQPKSKEVVDRLHTQHGNPKKGMFDQILGYRWDEALDALPPKTTTTTQKTTTDVIDNTPKDRPKNPSVEKITPNFEGNPGQDFGKTPYTQDILNLANATANQYAYPQIGPYAARYNPIYMDPAFTSTEAADRLIQSQGKTAMEDATMYAGSPQSQAARQAQINSQILPNMIQNRMQTNAQNVQTDMAARQYNTQIANQAGMLDAQISSKLGEDNARFAMNRAKEKVAGRTMSKNMLNQLLTNAGDTYLMNQWYPQEAFNPLDYSTYFKKGSGRNIEDQAAGSDASTFASNLAEAKAYADSLGLTSGKDRNDAIMDYLGMSTGKPARRTASSGNRRASADFNDGSQQQQQQQQKVGGFVPMYYLGGWH